MITRRLRYVAVHEAGHVIAYCRLGGGIIQAYVDEGLEGGRCWAKKNDDKAAEIACCYAGPFAEARYRHCSVIRCAVRTDFEIAREFALEMYPNTLALTRLTRRVCSHNGPAE
jgi:hypothetical protein